MPGGDRTGPAGMGPMTGRGAGYCAGYGVPGFMNPVARGGRGFGCGFGFGRGRGGGWGWRGMGAYAGVPAVPVPMAYGPVPGAQQELAMLSAQAEDLQNALAQIRERINELEAEKQDT